MKIKSKVLIIAGSDSSGGAGIQADIKTITALGSYAMTAITAITAQNTTGVKSIIPVPPKEIFNQIELKLEDEDSLTPHAIASLASSALTAQKLFKNVTPASTSAPVDTESFQRALELLDEVAELKAKKSQ